MKWGKGGVYIYLFVEYEYVYEDLMCWFCM
jgi:hypothetical protein